MDKNERYGLVLCGGKSSRMGADKGLLDYHGQAQRYHVYEMLQQFCSQTFISCNSSQTDAIAADYQTIEDIYSGIGPMGAVLTAFSKYPEQSFLVIGCDYPFLDRTAIGHFLAAIDSHSIAAAFYDEEHQTYQPVLAWYSKAAGPLLMESFRRQNHSLQQFLKSVNADRYIPLNNQSMLSVDTVAAKEEAMRQVTNHHTQSWKIS